MTTTAGPMATATVEYSYHNLPDTLRHVDEDFHNFLADCNTTEQEADAFPWPNINMANGAHFLQQHQQLMHQSSDDQPRNSMQSGSSGHSGQPTGPDVKPRLSKDQIVFLEQRFNEFAKPSTATKKSYADQLGVPLEKINNWFQNRRAKVKQDQKKLQNAINLYQQNGMHNVINSGIGNHIYDPATYQGSQQFEVNADGSITAELVMANSALPNPPVLPSTPNDPEYVFAPRSGTTAPPVIAHDGSSIHSLNQNELPQEVFMNLARNDPIHHDISMGGMSYEDSSVVLGQHQMQLRTPSIVMDLPQLPTTSVHMATIPSGFNGVSSSEYSPLSTLNAHGMPPGIDAMDHWPVVEGGMVEGVERQMRFLHHLHGAQSEMSNNGSVAHYDSVGSTNSSVTDHTSPSADGQSLQNSYSTPSLQIDSSAASESLGQPMPFPGETLHRHASMSNLTDSINAFDIQTPHKESSPSFKQPPQPSSFANRRAKRPAALGSGTPRSISYHHGMTYAGISKHAPPKSPRITLPGEPYPRSTSSPLGTPGAAPPTASTLAPPTPHTPQPESTHWPPWQAPPPQSMHYTHDGDFSYVSSPAVGFSPAIASPPTTPYNHGDIQLLGKAPFQNPFQAEDTPPQSAPATQQSFPGNPFSTNGIKRDPQMRFLGPNAQHNRQRSLGVQRRQPADWITEQPQPLSASTHASHGSMNMPFTVQFNNQYMQSSEQLTPNLSESHSLSRKTSSTGSLAAGKEPELVVHQYEPPNPAAPGDRKTGTQEPQPKSLTWNNQTPESFLSKRSPTS